MKDFILLIIVGIVFFFATKTQPTRETYAVGDSILTVPVSPEIVQGIIESFQQKNPDMHPISTVFVNIHPEGGYIARILFYNTKYFFGSQYDIIAFLQDDGIMSIKTADKVAMVDIAYGYKPDEYTPWNDVEISNNKKFTNSLDNVPKALQTRA